MAFVPPARHLLRAKDLADSRYFERLDVADLARAAGLSRAERVNLTEMLLALDPSMTLILIEHDMDVALRVAEWVTMMHDGRVIVEGTPSDIRANETVHALYLGSHA